MEAIPISNGFIHTYQSTPNGFWVNSYIIELAEGIIVVDTQFILSEAKKLHQLMQRFNKKILAIIITHPHPDHFNGTAELLNGENKIPVYASAATITGIQQIELAKREYWKPMYGDDYPDYSVLPNVELKSGTTIEIAGLKILIEDIGEGETSNSSLLFLPQENILIAADLAYNKAHPWLSEGHSNSWLNQLEVYYEMYKGVSKVLPGHGLPADAILFKEQKNYISAFKQLVDKYADKSNYEISENDRNLVKNVLINQYPGFQFEGLIDMNITGVLIELRTALINN